MTSPPPPTPTDQPILFRPGKKRKLYRQRDVSPPPAAATAPAAPAQSLDELIASGGSAGDAVDDAGVSLAEILRLRKQRRARQPGGVEFRAEGHGRDGERGEHDSADYDEGGKGGEGEGVVRRFAPQTGVLGKGDVDRHM
jgi:hypothetical protein